MNNIILFTDGASKGNPGPASAGAVAFLREDDHPHSFYTLSRFKTKEIQPIFQLSESLGKKTNNEAEYLALVKALEILEKRPDLLSHPIRILMDSELIVKQIKKEYKVKKPELMILYQKVLSCPFFHNLQFSHIPREENSIADFLANLALK